MPAACAALLPSPARATDARSAILRHGWLPAPREWQGHARVRRQRVRTLAGVLEPTSRGAAPPASRRPRATATSPGLPLRGSAGPRLPREPSPRDVADTT